MNRLFWLPLVLVVPAYAFKSTHSAKAVLPARLAGGHGRVALPEPGMSGERSRQGERSEPRFDRAGSEEIRDFG